MAAKDKCIFQPVGKHLFLLYSYGTGKYYLGGVSILPSAVKRMLDCCRIKTTLNQIDVEQIAKNAINPNTIDISVFKSPIVIGVMAVNQCNLCCKYCISAKGNGYSNTNVFPHKTDTLLNRINNSQIVSVIVSGGEPTLYNELPFFLENMNQQNFSCFLDTNGVIISSAMINILTKTDIITRISLDSINEHEHNYNRGNFKETLANIQRMLDKDIQIRVNTVINSLNLKSMPSLADWLIQKRIRKWHIYKLQEKFAPREIWVDDNEVEAVISSLIGVYGNKITILCKYSHTNDGFSSFIIDGEGNCFSTDNAANISQAKTDFGNIYNSDISIIWQKTPLDYRLRHYSKFLSWEGKNT
ncbi:MAG: radical SAM protein [Lachnospiraceae bacterium]|jgi:MoaA/NifB/PqqE/SkfB family radical SAM enzyme|nr:radical SAM protein [Lachnospiraceae bacterium]